MNTGPPALFSPTQPGAPFLLAADVDGTLLGDEVGEAWLNAFIQAHTHSLVFAVITGRTIASVGGLVRSGRLPVPHYVCGSVGTELFDWSDPENALGQKYAARVSPAWDLEAVYACGAGQGVVRQQFAQGQPRFQAAFDWDGQPVSLAAFRSRLADLPGCRILPSSGCFIDVFPALVGKGEAVRFLQQELRLDPQRVAVAGDSGNDREMFETGYRGILPHNALDELKTVAVQPWHYHSPFPAARGVLDGLRHFGWIRDII